MSVNDNDFRDYVLAVKFHLMRLRTEEGRHAQREPNVHEIAWARSQQMSPRRYAEWWQRRYKV